MVANYDRLDWQNFRLSTRQQLSAQFVEELYSKIAAVKNTFRLTQTLLPQTIEPLTRSVIVTSTIMFSIQIKP